MKPIVPTPTHAIPPFYHPVRVPPGVETTRVDPPVAHAGEWGTWTLPFILSRDVAPGMILQCQLTGGRNNRENVFLDPQVNDPHANGYVRAHLDDGTPLTLRQNPAEPFTLTFDLPQGQGLSRGRKIFLVMGDIGRGMTTGQGGEGIQVANIRLLNKMFLLYCLEPAEAEGSSTGAPIWRERKHWGPDNWSHIIAASVIHCLGGTYDHFRAYAPAGARPGKPIRIVIRPEDSVDNLASDHPGDYSLWIGDRELEAESHRIPGSTVLHAETALPEEGLFRIRLLHEPSKREGFTNPVRCSDTATPVFWGMIHGHTEMSDGVASLDHYFFQLWNEAGLDFGASADHDHDYETPDTFWKHTCGKVKSYNDPGEFVALLGYEWAKWRKNGDGDRNVYYAGDDRPMYRSGEAAYPAPPDLFDVLHGNGEEALVIPHHTGHFGNFCDWKDHDPKFERLVEIFQLRGSYECSGEEGNPLPERAYREPPFSKGYVREALRMGWRVGFTAGGDDHNGYWGTEKRFGEYKQGLMSLAAPFKQRSDIFSAMRERRVTATSGARILFDFQLNGFPMGSEIKASDHPETACRRHIAGEFHGTAPAKRIEIIRNGKPVHGFEGRGRLDVVFEWTDSEPLEAIHLPAAEYCSHPFTYYYTRAIQEDGEVAWASPIWIDP